MFRIKMYNKRQCEYHVDAQEVVVKRSLRLEWRQNHFVVMFQTEKLAQYDEESVLDPQVVHLHSPKSATRAAVEQLQRQAAMAPPPPPPAAPVTSTQSHTLAVEGRNRVPLGPLYTTADIIPPHATAQEMIDRISDYVIECPAIIQAAPPEYAQSRVTTPVVATPVTPVANPQTARVADSHSSVASVASSVATGSGDLYRQHWQEYVEDKWRNVSSRVKRVGWDYTISQR